MTERARTTARRALGLLGRVPLELLRSTWPSLLLLILWVTFAAPMWEGFTTIAAEPGGGRALFLFFGTLWVLSMLISDIHRCRYRTRTTVTLPAPLARMTSHLTPPEVLRRRARDLVQALVAAAAIISTGRTPNDHRGELTSDELLSTARLRATELLSTHDQLLDQVMQRLLDHPHESWCNPDLDALAQAPAA